MTPIIPHLAKRYGIRMHHHDLPMTITNKKIISISPGGYKGFYVLGICQYIKEHYNLDNYIFSGASAGSWNALAMCFKRDISEFQENMIDDKIQSFNTIPEMEKHIIKKSIT
jgi:predicted acylesterase/phospholipase RssA